MSVENRPYLAMAGEEKLLFLRVVGEGKGSGRTGWSAWEVRTKPFVEQQRMKLLKAILPIPQPLSGWNLSRRVRRWRRSFRETSLYTLLLHKRSKDTTEKGTQNG